MKICGMKLTHDGAVAGIEDGKLLFCVEVEKIAGNSRYARLDDLALARTILEQFNFWPENFVIDGWKHSIIPQHGMPVASYHEFDGEAEDLLDHRSVKVPLDKRAGFLDFYTSYPHMASHVFSAYCTAPFAAANEVAFVITWDGGQNPRVHRVDPLNGTVGFVASLFEMYGILYGIMGRYFGPYKIEGIETQDVDKMQLDHRFGGYDVPGKIMSYIALGHSNTLLFCDMMDIYKWIRTKLVGRNLLGYNQDGYNEHLFMRKVKEAAAQYDLSDADVLHTVHDWMQVMLVQNAQVVIPRGSNLCFAGGSALNIKWNSALRRTGHFKNVWVPPFPNDSGSAIGAACAEMVRTENRWSLDWSVYAGPELTDRGRSLAGWEERLCSVEELARFFADNPDEPVVFLNGRAEVGPRALGNRSIFCSATRAWNKQLLNGMKMREEFRPVAPICLEEYAPAIFKPGSPDPYMLFDHKVLEEWRNQIPAVVHIDNTARLQTVSQYQNPVVYELLDAYREITGIPLLCNTSANLNGSGFFPSVIAAQAWDGCRRVWSDGVMYTRTV